MARRLLMVPSIPLLAMTLGALVGWLSAPELEASVRVPASTPDVVTLARPQPAKPTPPATGVQPATTTSATTADDAPSPQGVAIATAYPSLRSLLQACVRPGMAAPMVRVRADMVPLRGGIVFRDVRVAVEPVADPTLTVCAERAIAAFTLPAPVGVVREMPIGFAFALENP